MESAVEIGPATPACFGCAVEVVEEGIHLKEVLLGDGVVFVVVADGAAEGEAHKGGADSGDAVDHIFKVGFLGESGATIDDEVEAIEAGSDELFLSGFLVEVASDLVFGEVIVGEILIKG